MPKPSKRADRLSDERVRRWYENLANGSTETAIVRLKRLWKFCETVGTTPGEYADLARSSDDGLTQCEDMLQDFVSMAQKAGYKGSYVAGVKKTVIGWLNYNHVKPWRTIKVKDAAGQYEGAVPLPDELRDIMAKADLRCKVSISLIGFAGLRPETLGSSTDGLKISDLPELSIRNGQKVEFIKVPMIVKVRRELSKTGLPYFTFLCEEGCSHLRRYLEDRMAHGEVLTGSSAVVAVEPGKELAGFRTDRTNQHVTPKAISTEIRVTLRPQYSYRPYDLRSYFSTWALHAESKYRTARDYRVFMMGHKGDIEAQYSTRRGDLPLDIIEDMRQTYVKYAECLGTEGLGQVQDELAELRSKNSELEKKLEEMNQSGLVEALNKYSDLIEDMNTRLEQLEKEKKAQILR